MKIVVIGGTGLIGSKTVAILRQRGHQVIAASPPERGQHAHRRGARRSPSGGAGRRGSRKFAFVRRQSRAGVFKTSEGKLLAAEEAGGVQHHVVLSIVAIDRTDNGYFRAKVAQEKLIQASGIPYTIVRSTQFMEFLRGIVDFAANGNIVKLPPALFQPIAADAVAAFVAQAALAAPQNGVVEIAGPEREPFNEIVARYLKGIGDPREVVSDPEARDGCARIEEHSLVPLGKRVSIASI